MSLTEIWATIRKPLARQIEAVLLAPHLGHGRMMETYLAAASLLYGVILMVVPDAPLDSQATRDAVFDEIGRLIALPFLATGSIAAYGIVGNIKGWHNANGFRFVGAVVGFALFTWYVLKFFLIGAIGTLGFPFALVSVGACVRVMFLSAIGLPLTGAPGKQ